MRLPSRTFGLLQQRENDSFRYDSYGNLLSDLGDVPVLPRSGKDRPGLLLSTPSLATLSDGFFIEGPGAKKLCAVGQAATNAIDMPAENKFVPYQ